MTWARCQSIAYCLAAIAILQSIGCGYKPPLEDRYGRRKGRHAVKSVNGVNVLSSMFSYRGWDCVSWSRFSPKLKEADVILWAPDSFVAPSDEQVDWLADWLEDGSGRTLVLIGRDYDAAAHYWPEIAANAQPNEKQWIDEYRKDADLSWNSDRRAISGVSECRWYRFKKRNELKHINTISAQSGWAKDVDPSKLDIRVRSELLIPSAVQPAEILLEDQDGEILAYRVPVGDGHVVVVTNGSFLLNLPLVNHEHRKLAGKLIDDCSDEATGRRAMFLEGSPLRLQIYEEEPAPPSQNSFTLFTIWPLSILLLHLALLGIFACFVVFPIFGRPKRIRDTGVSDFGKHIEALGALLAATENQQYAVERLKHYEEHVRRESRDA